MIQSHPLCQPKGKCEFFNITSADAFSFENVINKKIAATLPEFISDYARSWFPVVKGEMFACLQELPEGNQICYPDFYCCERKVVVSIERNFYLKDTSIDELGNPDFDSLVVNH